MSESKLAIIVALILLIAGTAGFLTAPEQKSAFHNLLIGITVSAIFYFIVVWLPAKLRRDRILRNLSIQYKNFRLSCIGTFLIASDSQSYGARVMLLDQDEFRRYFKIDVGDRQTRWDAVMNGLEGNTYLLSDLRYELETFREEIQYVLATIDVHDEEVFGFMKRLSQVIQRVKNVEPGSDDLKVLARFFWEVFTGWNFVEGYLPTNIMGVMIEKA